MGKDFYKIDFIILYGLFIYKSYEAFYCIEQGLLELIFNDYESFLWTLELVFYKREGKLKL
jgi:hypothetical protein